MKAVYILISVLFLFSCEEKNETFIDSDDLLLGDWSSSIFANETITFNRVSELPEEFYGVSFKDEGVFIDRSSGFCGTPPISYFNIEGGWFIVRKTQRVSTLLYRNLYRN